MTDQERQMIEALAKRIQDAPAPQIDRDADDLIRRAIGARTDALYILTQTVLIQEMALTQAKAQIDELKQRVPAAGAGSSSFLGSTSAERAPQQMGWAQETGGQQPGGYRYRRSRKPSSITITKTTGTGVSGMTIIPTPPAMTIGTQAVRTRVCRT